MPPDSLLPEEEDPIDYQSADSIVFHVRDEQVALHGEAKVETAGIELKAARIDYFAGNRQIDAGGVPDSTGALTGRPVFTQGGQSFTQDGLSYDLNSRKGLSRQAVTKEGELTFHAERAKRFPDGRIFLKGHVLHLRCAQSSLSLPFDPRLARPQREGGQRPDVRQGAEGPPPSGPALFWFPQKQERSRGILFPSFGNGRELGYFIKDLGWYEPLGEHWDARIQGDLYSRGTWRLSAGTQYRYRYRFNGNFNISRSSIVSGGTAGDPGPRGAPSFLSVGATIRTPKPGRMGGSMPM